MPVMTSTITTDVWICNYCARGSTHVSGSGSYLPEVHFVEVLHWTRIEGDRPEETLVACDRCKKIPDVARQLATSAAAREARPR